MGFGEQYGARDAPGLILEVGELHVFFVDDREPRALDGPPAQRSEPRRIGQERGVTTAIVKVSGEVQALHSSAMIRAGCAQTVGNLEIIARGVFPARMSPRALLK